MVYYQLKMYETDESVLYGKILSWFEQQLKVWIYFGELE